MSWYRTSLYKEFNSSQTIDTMRFVRPMTYEVLNSVHRGINSLPKRLVGVFEVELEPLDETGEAILIAELLKIHNLPLK